MADTALEAARRCPKCKMPGEDLKQDRLPGGAMMHYIYCRNSRCEWSDTPWLVQVMPNGEIAERKAGPQQFAPRSADYQAYGRRVVEDAVKRDLRDS